MEQVTKLLNDPALRAGLHVVAPQLGLTLDLVGTVVSTIFGGKRKVEIGSLLAIIDRQIADHIKELTTTKSKTRQLELEVRIHTLLGIILELDKT